MEKQNSEKMKALEAALGQIEKQFGIEYENLPIYVNAIDKIFA